MKPWRILNRRKSRVRALGRFPCTTRWPIFQIWLTSKIISTRSTTICSTTIRTILAWSTQIPHNTTCSTAMFATRTWTIMVYNTKMQNIPAISTASSHYKSGVLFTWSHIFLSREGCVSNICCGNSEFDFSLEPFKDRGGRFLLLYHGIIELRSQFSTSPHDWMPLLAVLRVYYFKVFIWIKAFSINVPKVHIRTSLRRWLRDVW